MSTATTNGSGGARTRQLFGTDGVRGVANIEPMTSETALRLGRAVAYVFRRTAGRRHKIIIGKDTRISGYMLETAMASGICSMGVDVLLVGPLPTPGIAFLTRSLRADAGAVISASHNPFQDNGIKFFSSQGFKLPDDVELEIERLVLETDIDHLIRRFLCMVNCASNSTSFRPTRHRKSSGSGKAAKRLGKTFRRRTALNSHSRTNLIAPSPAWGRGNARSRAKTCRH